MNYSGSCHELIVIRSLDVVKKRLNVITGAIKLECYLHTITVSKLDFRKCIYFKKNFRFWLLV